MDDEVRDEVYDELDDRLSERDAWLSSMVDALPDMNHVETRDMLDSAPADYRRALLQATRHSSQARKLREAYYQTITWKRKADAIKAGRRWCENCGHPPARRSDLNVHHRHYRTFGDERPNDLALLCEMHHWDLEAGRRFARELRGPFPRYWRRFTPEDALRTVLLLRTGGEHDN